MTARPCPRSLLAAVVLLSAGAAPEPEESPLETTVRGTRPRQEVPPGRAASRVTRREMERRLPRSAPDALRYEPGVYVQQTSHGQGSAFIRGFTGQQTLILFDGIRLNNSTYRQGPNQYFFTLDARTVESIEVMRGGGSTRFGSDALGGVINARPLEPTWEPGARATLASRLATADREGGARFQVDGSDGERVAVVAGGGARRVGFLRAGGQVAGLDGVPAQVPRMAADGRTQLGTGFDEVTADGRVVHRLGRDQEVTTAAYLYRQYNAPRTDQCPPPGARFDECMKYDEQFRTLAYGAWEGRVTPRGDRARATWSWQRQHELRSTRRPASFVRSVGEDDVDTWGVTARLTSRPLAVSKALTWRLTVGADTYLDRVRSRAAITFTDIQRTVPRSRGQYLDGSTYLYGGAFAESQLDISHGLAWRVGTRFSWLAARAPADPVLGGAPLDRQWFPVVGNTGLEWRVGTPLTLVANVDRSFRAPNLDDMTSRQQTGPGFQFESPGLQPERATSLELGLRLEGASVQASAWAFRTLLDGAVVKQPRSAADCPTDAPECRASWNQYQLVNAPGQSQVVGLESAWLVRLPWHLQLRGTVAWARGDGPHASNQQRVPLSRIPPLNGTAELDHVNPMGLAVGLAVRWAASQPRLAVADRSDARIPAGGTPGYVVMDARVSYRVGRTLVLSSVLENVMDTPYRVHGSSVNGPGRGVVLAVEGSPF
jgi:iron complex outermembrane receptor protein/hemoglobin/transferrin/lactoferrin receptor protein